MAFQTTHYSGAAIITQLLDVIQAHMLSGNSGDWRSSDHSIPDTDDEAQSRCVQTLVTDRGRLSIKQMSPGD